MVDAGDNRVEPATIALASRPSIVVVSETKRMTRTNPNLDVVLKTGTEPGGSFLVVGIVDITARDGYRSVL